MSYFENFNDNNDHYQSFLENTGFGNVLHDGQIEKKTQYLHDSYNYNMPNSYQKQINNSYNNSYPTQRQQQERIYEEKPYFERKVAVQQEQEHFPRKQLYQQKKQFLQKNKQPSVKDNFVEISNNSSNEEDEENNEQIEIKPKQVVNNNSKQKLINEIKQNQFKKLVEKLTGTQSSSNDTLAYKITLLVFAILTAIAGAIWASTSYSEKKKARRRSTIWAWATGLSLFITLIMMCLIIAFSVNNTNSKETLNLDEIALKPLSKAKQVLNNPGPEFNSQYLLPEIPEEEDTWANRQRQLGLNLDSIEGPRANYRHRPEVDIANPRSLDQNLENVTGLNPYEYHEYMQNLRGYNRPEEIKRYPYMPNAAQFEHEAHLDDAEVQFGIHGQPNSYLINARPRDRKEYQSNANRNMYQAAPGGYQVPTTTHPWMEPDQGENLEVERIFGGGLTEHNQIQLQDKNALELAEELALQRKQQDKEWFGKLNPSDIPLNQYERNPGIKPRDVSKAPRDDNGHIILPDSLKPIETRQKKFVPQLMSNEQKQQHPIEQKNKEREEQEEKLIENNMPVRPPLTHQQQPQQSQVQIQQQKFNNQHNSESIHKQLDPSDPFDAEMDNLETKNVAKAFVNAFDFKEIATSDEITKLIEEASRGNRR